MNDLRTHKGFTLVELVIVIVIAGILAVGSVQFVGQATQGYSDAADRQQLATIGWIASEKVSRELRNALPNSLRLDSNTVKKCIEFIPVISGSHYLTLPGATPATPKSFTAVASGFVSTPTDTRIAVYPTSTSDIYSSGSGSLSSSDIDKLDIDTPSAGIDTITLTNSFSFSTSSPERRFFFTQSPIMYCIEGSRLNRYSDYGISPSFPSPSNPQIIIDKLNFSLSSFAISPATLTRNAIVAMQFALENGAKHSVDQEVQIRNVP
ncbi:type II secretion system protein [Alkalimarinus coralli]|uniref:type II secretion system protein n=1 Tax=Alkalimarinus coralli TaxID=2935863 RepID=UPI00202AE477|nr:type II secretion system protein [Alkalimarinus coralli]